MSMIIPLVRKEVMEDMISTRGFIFLLIACAVLSVFSVLLVSNTELSLLDNAQAVYMMTSVIIALASVVGVIRGSDGFAGERERATLESLMLTPVTGQGLALAKLIGIMCYWLILFALSIPYLWAVGSTGQNLLSAIEYMFVTGTLMVLIFGGLALSISAKARSFKGALSIGLMIFLLAGSPVILGPSLRQSAVGKLIDLLNPFAGALNTLDSVVIDSQGLGFQLLRLTIMFGYSLLILVVVHTATKRLEL